MLACCANRQRKANLSRYTLVDEETYDVTRAGVRNIRELYDKLVKVLKAVLLQDLLEFNWFSNDFHHQVRILHIILCQIHLRGLWKRSNVNSRRDCSDSSSKFKVLRFLVIN